MSGNLVEIPSQLVDVVGGQPAKGASPSALAVVREALTPQFTPAKLNVAAGGIPLQRFINATDCGPNHMPWLHNGKVYCAAK
jgi:hypothetical protein